MSGVKISAMVAIIVIAVVALAAMFWYMLAPKRAVAPSAAPAASTTPSGFGAAIYQKAQAQQQVVIPSVNPIQNANPIANSYQNPF